MTILAKTEAYLVEYEAGFLSIARYSDGKALGLQGKRIAGDFKECLKKEGAERTIATYIRMAEAMRRRELARPGYRSPLGSLDTRDEKGWDFLYKPDKMPR